MHIIGVYNYDILNNLKSFQFEQYWSDEEIYIQNCQNFDELEILYFKLQDPTYLEKKFSVIQTAFYQFYDKEQYPEKTVIRLTRESIRLVFQVLINNAKLKNVFYLFKLFERNKNVHIYEKYELNYQKYKELKILSPWLRICAVGNNNKSIFITGGFIKSTQIFQESIDGRFEILKYEKGINYLIENTGVI